MFDENFSFDTPRSPSLASSNDISTCETSRSVSPCSPTSAFPLPRFSVSDLTTRFGNQRIRTDSQIHYDSCESYANNDDDAGWAIPSIEEDNEVNFLSKSRTLPQRPHSPSRRMQRQMNTRLLCNASHHRDIAALVSRMVEAKEQCVVTPLDSLSPNEVEDEGYNSAMDERGINVSRRSSLPTVRSRTDLRRGSEMKSTGACVSKSIRFRKTTCNERSHRRIRGAEKA